VLIREFAYPQDNAPARALYEKLDWGLMPDDVVYAKDLT